MGLGPLAGGLMSSGSRNRSSRQSPAAGSVSVASSCLCSPGSEDALACRGASRKRRRVSVLEPRASGLYVAVLPLFPPLPPSLAVARLEVPTAPGCSLLWLSGFPCFVYSCSRCAALGRSPCDMGTQVSPVSASHAQR